MKSQFIVDTDVVIDFLRGYKQAVNFFNMQADHIAFSTITVAEIYTGIKEKDEEAEVQHLFSIFPIFAVTSEIAKLGGKYMQEFRSSHGMQIPDALIAATCAITGSELMTLNVKHYPMFRHIKPSYKKS